MLLTLQNENQKIGSIFRFSIPNDKWKSENWTYFLIFIFKLKMKIGNHRVISDFLFQIRKGNLNCGIVHGPSSVIIFGEIYIISDPDRSYILIFPEKKWKHSICTTRINRNNFGRWPEWNTCICLSAFSKTADLTCNHSHCIWRVYSSAFLLAPI